MKIGHVLLQPNGCIEHFVRLVEGLEELGVEQHVIVSSRDIASRVNVCEHLSIGPATSSAVMAMALMHPVRLLHVHDDEAGRAGLLSKLTRSTPYVVTRRDRRPLSKSPILRSVYARAACVIATSPEAGAALDKAGIDCPVEVIADLNGDETLHAAAEHLRIYRRATDRLSMPSMLL